MIVSIVCVTLMMITISEKIFSFSPIHDGELESTSPIHHMMPIYCG